MIVRRIRLMAAALVAAVTAMAACGTRADSPVSVANNELIGGGDSSLVVIGDGFAFDDDSFTFAGDSFVFAGDSLVFEDDSLVIDNDTLVIEDDRLSPSAGSVVRVGNMRVVPDQAAAGDTVKLVFDLVIAPERTFTMTAFVDGVARASETRTGSFDGVFEVVVGTGADLIAVFGAGFHSARLDLRVSDPGSVIVNQGALFELR